MKILAIETSCDETAISIVEIKKEDSSLYFFVLSDAVYSQVDIHRDFGGVVPNLAKRAHGQNLVPLLEKTLKEAKLLKDGATDIQNNVVLKELLKKENELYKKLFEFVKKYDAPDIDIINVTCGPGLEPALWVGINFAKALGVVWNKPVMPINHMEGHIFSALIEPLKDNSQKINCFILKDVAYPAIAMLISGGHTELVLIKNPFIYEVVGKTRDDAVGEAFDKVARLLGLPYPGGPEISRLAENASDTRVFTLPRPMIGTDDFDFSFSGLKTAVLYALKKKDVLTKEEASDMAREFEDSVTDVLVSKTKKAIEKYNAQSVIIGGGVSANKKIRSAFAQLGKESELPVYLPTQKLSTDNAIMIAVAGYMRHSNKYGLKHIKNEFTAMGNLAL